MYCLSLIRYELYSKNQNRFQEVATKQLVGVVILTRYQLHVYKCVQYIQNAHTHTRTHAGTTTGHTVLMTLLGTRILRVHLLITAENLSLSLTTTSEWLILLNCFTNLFY